MYSKEVETLLEKSKASIGDTIKLHQGKESFTGVIMPRPDLGDASILVIKQENGYNIGIKIGKTAKMEKVNVEKKAAAVPKAAVKVDKNLPKVGLIYTGGTIGSKVDYASGGVYSLTKPEELIADIPELGGIANLEISNPFSILSEDMGHHEWKVIAENVAKVLNGGAKGVVVTHGTDTMHYSSAALSFMLSGLNAPVVYTGAQRSSDRGSSDAFLNVIAAARVAAQSNIAEVGICMHGSSSDNFCDFIRGTKVRKMHTSRRDAFRPINNLPIARVQTNGAIEYISKYTEVNPDESGKVTVSGKFEPRVALLKVYPNSDPEIIDYYRERDYLGIIIEGTGLGHVPVTPSSGLGWIPAIKRATDAGLIVGVASQTLYGRTSNSVYRNLRTLASAGALHCEDMLPETAYVKLGWLLANKKREEVAKLLVTNLVGEITERIETDMFLE